MLEPPGAGDATGPCCQRRSSSALKICGERTKHLSLSQSALTSAQETSSNQVCTSASQALRPACLQFRVRVYGHSMYRPLTFNVLDISVCRWMKA